eukprot:gene19670-25588_t
MKFYALIVVLVALLSQSAAFVTKGNARVSKLNMAFSFGKKSSASEPAPVKGYVPAGLTPTQYAAVLKKEAEEKAKKQSRYPKGKVTESLTEWMDKYEKKGIAGKDLNLKGHRMVKAKYENFYTNESPI